MKHWLYISLAILNIACSNGQDLVFSDEFDGQEVNENNWNFMLGDGCPNLCGWGNNERQLYTKENAQVRDGKLVITATKKGAVYSSARLTTEAKVEFKYGTIEVRAQLPQGQGLWPAIWMLGSNIEETKWPNCGEIDIMEYVGKQPGVIYTSLHTAASYGETINSKRHNLKNIEEGFHTYAAQWTENEIKFSIDGQLVYTFAPEDKNEKTWPFDQPFYVLINMAIGGNFGGPEVDDSIFPQEFVIDYVRVYKQ
ncbi:MAG: glycoside hydrolase family 16 protein [Gilvibacter sp.]